jgi:AAA15 family ATPase/GTPase
MLQQIHIQNFRCFEDFKAEGFERVNLIGGKNNSGKSCLLEGIYAALRPDHLGGLAHLRNQKINDLVNTRNQKMSIIKTLVFDYTLYENEETAAFQINFEENRIENQSFTDVLFNSRNINLITQKRELPTLKFVEAFDSFAIKKVKDRIIEIVKIVDSTIDDISSYSSKGDILFVSKVADEYRPINSYGDATQNLIKYFTPIFEKIVNKDDQESYLLIDEIENGIHYTAHEEFWQHLFKLCKELNVQVFATTHSLEMIKAFNAVALKEGEGAYFEMVREPESNNIKIAKHHSKLLQYELNQDEQIRGEY